MVEQLDTRNQELEKLNPRDENSFPVSDSLRSMYEQAPTTMSLFGKNGGLRKVVELRGDWLDILKHKIKDDDNGGWSRWRGIGQRLELREEGLTFQIFFAGKFSDDEKLLVRKTVKDAMRGDGILGGEKPEQ